MLRGSGRTPGRGSRSRANVETTNGSRNAETWRERATTFGARMEGDWDEGAWAEGFEDDPGLGWVPAPSSGGAGSGAGASGPAGGGGVGDEDFAGPTPPMTPEEADAYAAAWRLYFEEHEGDFAPMDHRVALAHELFAFFVRGGREMLDSVRLNPFPLPSAARVPATPRNPLRRRKGSKTCAPVPRHSAEPFTRSRRWTSCTTG